MPFFRSFDGVKVHYESYGEGLPLILLHGVPGQISNWKHVVKLLEKEYLLVAMDLRGYGISDKPEEFKLSDHVRDLEALIQELGLSSEGVVLVGHSYGCMVALEFASKLDVRGLILVSPPLRLKKDFTDWMILHLPSWLWKPLLFSSNFLTRRVYRKMFFSSSVPEEVWNEFMKDNTSYIESLPPQSFVNPSKLSYDASVYSGKIKARSLVIVGEEDVVTPASEARELAEIINAEFLEVPKAGHMVLYEKPEVIATAVGNFTKDLDLD